MNFIDACRKLISLESTPGHGNAEAATFIGKYCEQQGFYVTYQHETQNGLDQMNVLIRPLPTVPSNEILLQTHLDTVEAGNFALWTKTQLNPFEASIYGDRVFGLGAADTKLDVLCKIEAAKHFLKKPFKVPFVIAATYGAQSSMAGAMKLLRRKAIHAKKALIGEPTEMHIVHAGPGMAVVEISIPFSAEERKYRTSHDQTESASSQSKIFSGKAAHSSNPQMGTNAIVKMLEYLAQLPEGIAVMDLDGGVSYNTVPSSAILEIDLVGAFKDPIVPKLTRVMEALKKLEQQFLEIVDEGFEPPHPTMNVGMIRTFDDQVRLLGSCRLPPKVTDPIYEKWMAELEEACGSVGAKFRIRDYKRSFLTPTEGDLVESCRKILKQMGREFTPKKTVVSTEASVFSHLGIECVVIGPGVGVGNSHAPNESITLTELNVAVDFYKQFIEMECL